MTINITDSHGECQLSVALYLCFMQFIAKTLRGFFTSEIAEVYLSSRMSFPFLEVEC